jgi:hypothetical protein
MRVSPGVYWLGVKGFLARISSSALPMTMGEALDIYPAFLLGVRPFIAVSYSGKASFIKSPRNFIELT